ncbi:MAG: hypothetical protein U0587_19810 [Candidatus Binatia bacterium]
MYITMVKKRMRDGSDCRKCAEVTDHLRQRGLWHRIDEVVWAQEDDAGSPGVILGERLGVETAPFFVVRADDGETVYTSVLRLIQDRFDQEEASTVEEALDVDPDDIGGI